MGQDRTAAPSRRRQVLRAVFHSVFLRLLALYLLLTIPIFAFGIGIHSWAVSSISGQISQSVTAQSDFYLRNLDAELQRIRLLQYDFLNDGNLNDLAYAAAGMTPYLRSQKLLALQSRLNSLMNSSRYVAEAAVSLSALNKYVSAQTGVREGRDAYAGGQVRAVLLSPRSQFYFDGENLYSSVQNLQPGRDGQPFAFMLTVTVPLAEIRKDMAQFENGSRYVVLAGEGGRVFYPAQWPAGAQPLASVLDQGGEDGSRTLTINKVPYRVSYAKSGHLGLTLIQAIPESQLLSRIGQYRLLLWLYLALVVLLFVLFALSIYRMIHKPLRLLKREFALVEGGDLSNSIITQPWDEFHYLYDGFNSMVHNLNQLIDQNYKQRLLVQSAQLKQLQSQIDPHFLYNTFFILQSLAEAGDRETLTVFLRQLGVYFKYITRSGEEEMALEQEVEHARTYASIQELRFSNRIEVYFEDLPPRYAKMPVPRLILQPLLENAFKYVLEAKEDRGELRVLFRACGDTLRIVVEDNGRIDQEVLQGLQANLDSTARHREVTAIINIHQRLQLKFGPGSGLALTQSEQGGLRAEIVIQTGEGQDV